MAGIVTLRRSWGRQKPPPGTPLAAGHPLCRGLAGYWALNEAGGLAARNLAAWGSGQGDGTLSGGAAWTTAEAGPGVLLARASGQSIDCGTHARLNPTAAMTLAARVRADTIATSGTGQGCWAVGRDTDTGRSYAFGTWGTSGNSGLGLQINGAATIDGVAAAVALIVGRWHTIAATGSPALGWRTWLDGAPSGSAAWIAPAATSTPTHLGKRTYPSFEDCWDGPFSWVAIWSEDLSADGRLGQLALDPFAPFAPPAPRRIFAPAAAGMVALPPTRRLRNRTLVRM